MAKIMVSSQYIFHQCSPKEEELRDYSDYIFCLLIKNYILASLKYCDLYVFNYFEGLKGFGRLEGSRYNFLSGGIEGE